MPIGTQAGAGLPAGTYQYAYTWTSPSGETLPSPLSAFNPATSSGPAGAPTLALAAGTGLGLGRYRYAYT
jgi:hypothetical protein